MRSNQYPDESIALMEHLSQKYCDNNCYWYHNSWQYLKALDLVVTPQKNIDFFIAQIQETARTHHNLNILICGQADFAMFDVVITALEPMEITYTITALDICQTPLKMVEWYAKKKNIPVIIHQANAVNTLLLSDAYDIIVADAFLTILPYTIQQQIVSEWSRLLKQTGKVLTTLKLGQEIPTQISSIQIEKYVEKALQNATKHPSFNLNKVKKIARRYVENKMNYPKQDITTIKQLFANYEVTIANGAPFGVYQTFNYAQTIAQKV